jgi:5-methylcytosine-specific restriction protein A
MTTVRDSRWDYLYDSRAWRRRAALQYRLEPTCRHCRAKGIVSPAEIADHVIAHNGDLKLFYEGELQSLCKQCHGIKTAREKGQRVRPTISASGWPEGD